jgi:hypothetical protein
MLNLPSSADTHKHSVQQFRFYGHLADSSHRTSLLNMSNQCSITQLQSSNRTGSRVKTVGSWRRTSAQGVHDVSKVQRVLTKKNCHVKGSSKHPVQWDSLPHDASAKLGKTSLKCNNTTSNKVEVCPSHVATCQAVETASLSSTCCALVDESCPQNSVYNWLHSATESHGVMMCKSDAVLEEDRDVKSAVVLPQTCNKLSSCSCVKSKACNMCKVQSVKTSPESCSSSNASLTPSSSSSSDSSKTVLVSRRRSIVSSSECLKRRSRRLNRGLQMPDSPAVSDCELKDRSVDLNKTHDSMLDGKILVPDRPRRSVSMKKMVR